MTQKLVAGGSTHALTQLSYDALGRIDCTAVRMNPAVYGSLPSSACSLSTLGSHGPDRIGQAVYDAAGQLIQNKVAVGTTDAATERTLSYGSNGMLATLTDAESNRTTYDYDGHDRLARTRFPVTTKGANSSSTTDYEQPGYDSASNVTSLRNRAGETIAFTYDALNRQTFKNLPGTEPDVTYAYDNLGRLTSASHGGATLSFTYDALSRNLTQVGPQGTVTSQWDLAGRRTRLTYPGSGLYLDYDHLVTGEVTKIRENGATSGIGLLATYAFDNLGRRTALTFGNGAAQSYGYDAVSRLASLTNNLSGTTNDLTQSFTHNPAFQIVGVTRSNDAYAWTGHGTGSTAYGSDGLNRVTSVAGTATSHDAKGNLTFEPQTNRTYGYSSENLLTSASGGVYSASLAYDPLMRLQQIATGTTTRFAYDGLAMIAEYNASNALQRRFVHGPAIDEPIVWYEGTGTATRRFLHADERGSIVAISDASGAMHAINRYDEYGRPQSGNIGRFQYTGQMWLAELGAYHYKARMYAPNLGRFLQTDPIGYRSGTNLYAYVGNSPISFTDPLGLQEAAVDARVIQEIEPLDNPLLNPFGSRSYDWMGIYTTAGGSRLETHQAALKAARDWASSHGMTDRATIGAVANYLSGQGSLGSVASAMSGAFLHYAAGPGPGHNNPPLGVGIFIRRVLGVFGAIISLGGDTCKTCNQSVNVTFGHGARHLEGSGLNQEAIESAIRHDINRIFSQQWVTLPAGTFWGRVTVGGQTVTYRAHPLPNGTINVGTYTIPK